VAGVSFKVIKGKEVEKLLNTKAKEGLIPKVRKEFSKRSPKVMRTAIQKDILRGVSPVRGKRFPKYSKSYKEVIRGDSAYRTINGRVVKISTKGIKGKGAVKKRASAREFINTLNAEFRRYGKRISPINMKLSGDMLRKLEVFTRGQFTQNFRLVIRWKHFLADIHNRQGAGKSKVIRRLLPTNNKEKFNRTLSTKLLSELKRAVDIVAKKFS
jgi:ribosomal protein L34E